MRIIPPLLVLALPLAACARDAKPATSSAPPTDTHAHGTGAPHAMPAQPMPEVTAFVDPGAPEPKPVREAVAVLMAPSGQRMGLVRFVDTGQSLEVSTTAEHLPAGTHAYHIHVYGDCSAPDFKSAGPHFHFTGSSMDKNVKMITGNLGELVPTTEGRAMAQTRIPDARLQGPFSVMGRAVVVHAKGNDPSVTPDGGAGDRIACGVIGVANPTADTARAAR